MDQRKIQVIVYRVSGSNGEVLLLKRSGTDVWAPITGGVEVGETYNQAARRELLEEVGARSWKKFVPSVHSFTFINPPVHRRPGLVHEEVFGCEVDSGFVPTLSEEHDDYRWVSFEQALEYALPKDQKIALEKLSILTESL